VEDDTHDDRGHEDEPDRQRQDRPDLVPDVDRRRLERRRVQDRRQEHDEHEVRPRPEVVGERQQRPGDPHGHEQQRHGEPHCPPEGRHDHHRDHEGDHHGDLVQRPVHRAILAAPPAP
jgi:hypothetical protein